MGALRYGNNLDEYIRLYNAMCTQIDANVGRLVATLERRLLDEGAGPLVEAS